MKEETSGVKNHHKTALITGASSGIGLELARLFAQDGYNLVLVARSQENLEKLAKEMEFEHRVTATIIVQDLTEPDAAQKIAEQLARTEIQVDVLVNNAGTQVYGEFAAANIDALLAVIQVNSTALVHLTHLLLPGMIRRGGGRILNTGSTGAFTPGPLNAVYCATKAFVLSFSQALGAELAGTGVTVTALCPGATDTAFVTRHGMQDVRIFRNKMAPERAARAGYQALLRGRPLIVPGLGNQIQVLSFQCTAPFLALTPPAWLMAAGRMFMGRSGPRLRVVPKNQEV